MVALFIMSIATVLLLANYPDSTIRMALLNSTHTFALQIREAQIRGSAVDSASSTAGGYGVLIDSANSLQSILFSDNVNRLDGSIVKNSSGFPVGDGLYDKAISPTDAIKSTIILKERFSFGKLCVASTTALESMGSPTPQKFLCSTVNAKPISTLTISFIRPSQVAHMYINGTTTADFESACIQLFSPKTPNPGHIRSVRVFHSGVITTTATSCN